MAEASALECENLTKVFGGLVAVDHVNLRVTPGERRAIIGPNGAGKTTFFSVINGIHRVSSGSIRIYGRDVTNQPIRYRTRLGLGRTFQITTLFPTLTVLENLVIAAMGLKMAKFSMLKPLSTYRHFYETAENLLGTMEMSAKGGEVVKNLSYGEQRQIEVCLALISNPRILLLDEPTAGLSPADSVTMANVIRKLNPAITVLIIEHDMDVAFQVANKITVLHNGRVFAEGSPSEIRNNEKVQAIYFGSRAD